MYRFQVAGQDWLLRFSANLEIEDDEKDLIIYSILQLGPRLASYSHGDSILIFENTLGAMVFLVEKIPSLMITALTVVPKEQWFRNKSGKVEPY